MLHKAKLEKHKVYHTLCKDGKYFGFERSKNRDTVSF